MSAVRKLERHKVGRRRSPSVERIPFGHARKMSDVIVELAEPMLKDDMTPEQFHLAIILAAAGWNLSLMPVDLRPALIEDLLRESVPERSSMADVREVVERLIERKKALFPNDKRLITNFQVSGTPGNGDIVVEYSVYEGQ